MQDNLKRSAFAASAANSLMYTFLTGCFVLSESEILKFEAFGPSGAWVGCRGMQSVNVQRKQLESCCAVTATKCEWH